MAIAKVSGPDFLHPNRLACGYYVARFLLQFKGNTTWPEAPKNAFLAFFHPTWPVTLQRTLLTHGEEADIVHFQNGEAGFIWVRRELAEGRPVALFVRAKPLHWIVVAGWAEGLGKFYVYDPRIGKRSSSHDLAMGNRLMSKNEIMGIWRGLPLFRWIAVGLK